MLALTPIAIAACAYFIGMWGRRLVKKDAGPPTALGTRLLWPALGVFVLILLGMLPFVGFFVWIVALIIGLGAAVIAGGKALANQPTAA